MIDESKRKRKFVSKKKPLQENTQWDGVFFINEIEGKLQGGMIRRRGNFRCNCGNVFQSFIHSMKRSRNHSCGCVRKEAARKSTTKHGLTSTGEAAAWKSMVNRCHNPKNSQYHNYGARGIAVCDRWRYSLDNFIEDMGKKPSPHLSLDRLENSKGYYKENCAWRTDTEQQRNTRWNRNITYKGVTKCMAEWCEILGLTYHTLKHRLDRGWDVEAALFTEKKHYTWIM